MRTSVEGVRGCGYRQPGGIYLMADDAGEPCPLLPVPTTVCPTCGHGIRPARGWTWVTPDELLNPGAHGHPGCPLETPGALGERAGLLWIGEKFYPTPGDWLAEARTMGVSRRISRVPRGFVVGETWVLVAHRKALLGVIDTDTEVVYENARAAHAAGAVNLADYRAPGIFQVFRPDRIEYVVRGDETKEELQRIVDRGLEPVRVVPAEQMEMA